MPRSFRPLISSFARRAVTMFPPLTKSLSVKLFFPSWEIAPATKQVSLNTNKQNLITFEIYLKMKKPSTWNTFRTSLLIVGSRWNLSVFGKKDPVLIRCKYRMVTGTHLAEKAKLAKEHRAPLLDVGAAVFSLHPCRKRKSRRNRMTNKLFKSEEKRKKRKRW